MKTKLTALIVGLFNFNQNNYVIDERGGYFVKDLTGRYIIGYNYISGYYAGHFIRFSQYVGVELSNRLESSLDEHIPDITKNWEFNPELIKDEETKEQYSKCDLLIIDRT